MYQAAALAGTAREHPGGDTDHRRLRLRVDRSSRRRIIEGGLEHAPAENAHFGRTHRPRPIPAAGITADQLDRPGHRAANDRHAANEDVR